LSQAEQALISLFLPEGILDYFELSKVDKVEKMRNIHFEEKNIAPISCYHLGYYFQIDGKQLQEQYKDHLSDYNVWEQKDYADEWMLFTKNLSPYLSIDERFIQRTNSILSSPIRDKRA